MLFFFRTNQFVANIFLIIYAVLLRFSGFFLPLQGGESGAGALGQWALSLVGSSTTTSVIVAILLVTLQGTMINLIVARYRMGKELSLLPGLCYILLASLAPEFITLSPVLIANTFFILALYQLFNTYKKSKSAAEIFNTGFWIAMASLFYFSYLYFIILALIGLAELRAFRFRETMMLVIGMIVPYILAGTIYFWNDQLAYFISRQFSESTGFLELPQIQTWDQYVKLGVFGLTLLIALFSYSRYAFKRKIQVQKFIKILYWSLFFAGVASVFQANSDMTHLLIMVPALGVFLSEELLNLKSSVAEVVHLLFVIGILIFHFHPYLFG